MSRGSALARSAREPRALPVLEGGRHPLDFVFVGTSFRRAGFERLGGYVLSVEDPSEAAALRTVCGASEIVYVATCNRVEAYLAMPAAVPVADLAARVAAFFAALGRPSDAADFRVVTGAAALGHLFSVAASLDSLVLGECEIAGQLRRAAAFASDHGLSGPFLERAFERAARVAKRVRTETAIGRTPVSVASLVTRRIREHFHDTPPRAACLIGVGDVTKKVAAGLEGKTGRILFVNRTLSRAAELAARHGGSALSLERFQADPPADVDVVVTATRAPATIVGPAMLGRALAAPRAGRMLICDLGVPADVDAALGADPRVRLIQLADLEVTAQENRARLDGEVGRASALVAEEVAEACAEGRLRALAEESADAILASRLAHLAPDDRATVRRFATGLAERLARQPHP